MGCACRKHDSSCGIFFPGIQSALRSLLCSDGSDQKRDEQCKMVLVCSRLSDIVGVCCFSLCLPDWNLDYYRTFGIATAVACLLVIGFMYLLVRPYKESKTLHVNMKAMAGAK